MANGYKRSRGSDDYLFIDGRALRSDEVVRIDLRADDSVMGSGEATADPVMGSVTDTPKQGLRPADSLRDGLDKRRRDRSRGRRHDRSATQTLQALEQDDAFALVQSSENGLIDSQQASAIVAADKRLMRTKYLTFGIALVALILVSLCLSPTSGSTFYAPADVISSIGAWFHLRYVQLFQNHLYVSTLRTITVNLPCYADCMLQVWTVFKYAVCGALLALSGMLYQNTFRNPIAAPSMLGVSNGISFAILILVLQYGYAAVQHIDAYYLYALIGGISALVLVMAGGKWVSGKGRFNTVNMILMGTILSQLLGVCMSYAQAFLMDDMAWEAYYRLQSATGITSAWSYGTLIIGSVVALIPIILFRFKLNLISFSDQEARLLGIHPTKLRIVALGCGSIMILIAQLNAGQVAMASLVVPFIVRAIFGSEFRKQLMGNILVGALLLLFCGDLGLLIRFYGMPIGLGTVVSVLVIPLFVWMLALQQRSWE